MSDDSSYSVPCPCGGWLFYEMDLEQPHVHHNQAAKAEPVTIEREDDEAPQTITFLDSDDSEEALFSYMHDAILDYVTSNGDHPERGDDVLSIASAAWNVLLSRRVDAAQPVTETVEWGVWAFGDPGDLQTFETENAARSYGRINSHDGDKIARRTVSEWVEVPNE